MSESSPAPESVPPPVEPASSSVASESTESTPPLSKNAQKKARKAELMKVRKLERRVREKEARKEKKRKRAERIAAGEELSEDEQARKRAKASAGPKTPFDARVLIDLGFDEMMSEKEVGSLISQLSYSYSVNRRAQTPFTSILFTSLNGRTKARMDEMNDSGYSRWTSTEWWGEEFDDLWAEDGSLAEPLATAPQLKSLEPEAVHDLKPASTSRRARATKSSIVYLTADSSDVLEELKEGETYIIGGICDHNRYKNLCLDKANKHGIRAAQLPIGRYLQNLPTRKVLTVNQVFEILVKWAETRNWEDAFYSVIPKRKFQPGKGSKKVANGEGSEEEDDVAEDDGVITVALEDVEDDAGSGSS
ncbi:hypothetical protein PENSPDRAFT_651683 [Peniophora sp. CONT]|nr:hypothetical protein PENSPDRAFT_651683 [Peniophora sp. CONT]